LYSFANVILLHSRLAAVSTPAALIGIWLFGDYPVNPWILPAADAGTTSKG